MGARIVITSCGSYGDIYPYLGLAGFDVFGAPTTFGSHAGLARFADNALAILIGHIAAVSTLIGLMRLFVLRHH